MRYNYKTWGMIILALLVASLVVLRDPWKLWPTKEGLDIAGGVRVVMELKPAPGVAEITSDTQQQVIDVIDRRVNALGVSEPVIQKKGDNQVIVELAERRQAGKPLDKIDAVETLRKAAKLEFVHLKNVKSPKNPLGRYEMLGESSFRDLQANRTLTEDEVRNQILYVDENNDNKPDNVILTGSNLKPGTAHADLNPGGTGALVTLELDREGTDQFADFTSNNVKELMAIVYDGKVYSAPEINEPITTGQVQITLGDAPLQEAIEMADLLNSGALPVPLEVVQIQEVEASLGRDAVAATERAGIVGLVAVILFMLAYYLLPGFVASLALIFYALITFAAFKLMGVVLTLPGIAGFILSIGMAVDANILIFERMKEEMRSGKTLHSAIDAGFSRAFPSIRDSNLATLITCIVLWMYGTGAIRGFALVLGLGVLISFFSAITVSRTLLHLFVNEKIASRPALFGVTRSWMTNSGPRLKVVRHRGIYFILSGLLIGTGLVFLAMGGLKPGIDFTGGSMLHFRFAQDVRSEQVRSAIQGSGVSEMSIQLAEGDVEGTEDAFVRTRELTTPQREQVVAAVKKQFPKANLVSYDQIGPSISRELVINAFWTVALASGLILLFLAYQFQSAGFRTGLKYGINAVLALIHDVLVLVGIFAIAGYFLNWEVDSLFVTAVLTVIGFSVHDTIIIFDRVRENWRFRSKGENLEDVIDGSVNQTLSRSINTTLTVIITLLALFLLGGSTIKLFVAAMLFGIIAGTYSSIFFASPMLWVWEKMLGETPSSAPAPARQPEVPPGAPRTTARPQQSRPVAARTEGDGDGDGRGEWNPPAGGAPRPTARPGTSNRVQVRPKRKKRF